MTRAKLPADANRRAFTVVQIATGEIEPEAKSAKAVARGRKGGAARAAALTPEKRKKIAKKAAAARWDSRQG